MSNELIIPIYVDTNSLLDLLASIEDGFSVVEKMSTHRSSKSNIDREVNAGTEFGIPNVLNLLKLSLGYGAKWGKAEEASEGNEYEKYHTYGSLFYRLREYLESKGLIKRIENSTDWETSYPSDFIEIRGIFRPNPLADSFAIMDRLIGIAELFSGSPKLSSKSKPDSTQAKLQLEQMKQIRKFLSGILNDLQKESIRIFVIDLIGMDHHKAVALIYPEYLRDKTMTEISHREYYLLGKIVRKLGADSSESIDLLSGTALSGVGEEMMNTLVSSFSSIPGMNLPKVELKVSGPALEIVPIAIFV